jgi:hypothetical protein
MNNSYFLMLQTSVIRTAVVLRAGQPRSRDSSLGRVKNYYFFMFSRPALGSTQPPLQWVPMSPFLRGYGKVWFRVQNDSDD